MRLCYFYVVRQSTSSYVFKKQKYVYVPRFDLELAHPQHATNCFLRLKQPRAPLTNGRVIRIPECWTKRNFDLQLHSEDELENLNEFALYVISRYCPLKSGKEIVLTPSLSMYLHVKR
jgi:hypothetical protein